MKLNKATGEAQTENQRLIGEARLAADALSANRQAELRNNASDPKVHLRHR